MALLIGALAIGAAACGTGSSNQTAVIAGRGSGAQSDPSILFITLDTVRADHLGCYGYRHPAGPTSPNIDRLLRRGLRFEHCVTTRGQTAPALASLMTARYPSAHGVRDNGMAFSEGQRTLFERLEERGYRTRAFLSKLPAVPAGHPARGVQRSQAGARFEDGRQAAGNLESDLATAQKAVRFLEEEAGAARDPFCAWVHFYGAHKPYEADPAHLATFAGDYAGPLAAGGSHKNGPFIDGLDRAAIAGAPLADAEHAYTIARYDAALRTVDDRVGEVLDALLRGGSWIRP